MLFCMAMLLQYDERQYKMMSVFYSMFKGAKRVRFEEAILPFSACCNLVFCI